MTKCYTVYKITRISTGQIYIGIHQTANLDDGYMGSGKRIMAAIAKYGLEDFKKEILFIFKTEEEMTAKEKELVTEEFCKREDTYNIAPGGVGGGFKYINLNNLAINIKEQRRRNPDKMKEWYSESGQRLGKETVAKRLAAGLSPYGLPIGDSFRGRTHTEETKIKMSKAHVGKHEGNKNSQFGTMWLTDGIKNVKIKQDEPIPEGWYRGRV